jgi:Protein of unknown function (DUF1592)/Protein of unknown function (DUF1588)/Protein of unknown function (DUF1595)/Protein of unknown function (DUF1585)/Protein of unknown function (DUF1587)
MRFPFLVSLLISAGFFHAQAAEQHEAIRSFFTNYCIDCHGATKQKADRRYDELVFPITKQDTLFELQDAIDQLNLGEMPPEDHKKRPSPEEVTAIVAALTEEVTAKRKKLTSTGGQAVLRRLNQREYRNTLGTLFGMNMIMFDPTLGMPRDEMIHHLDTIGSTLQTSPFLLDLYLSAADKVVSKAFATYEKPPEKTWVFKGPKGNLGVLRDAQRDIFKENFLAVYTTPYTNSHEGTYAALENDFPNGVHADGLYEITLVAEAKNRKNPYDPQIFGMDFNEPFRLGIVPGNKTLGALDDPQPIEPLLGEVVLGDQKRETHVLRIWLDAGNTPRFVFVNGMNSLRGALVQIINKHLKTFPAKVQAEKPSGIVEARKAVIRHGLIPHIRVYSVTVRGPLHDTWPSASHKLVIGDEPFRQENSPAIIARFAERAFRRPVTKEEIDRFVQLERKRRNAGRSPSEALQDALKGILCSPSFLYLVEPTPSQAGNKALTAHALASRLSYFLWANMPDDALLAAAKNGSLLNDVELIKQTQRMLADPRSDAFVAGFLDSWLNLRALGEMPPDGKEFSIYYRNNFEQAMKTETRMFFRYALEHNSPVSELLSANYTFANRALAKHYGMGDVIPAKRANVFEKITFTNNQRGGLLGHASVLTVSANGIETSPVTRGVWVLENILGVTLPPPPDIVPAIDPDLRGATSIRDIITKHRENAACFECHRKIDPVGFALENFDPIGGWRSEYVERKKSIPIDASGQLPSGQKFKDIGEFKSLLLKRQETFVRAITEKLLSYSCGRQMEPMDRGNIDALLAALTKRGGGLRDLIELIVTSETFKNK